MRSLHVNEPDTPRTGCPLPVGAYLPLVTRVARVYHRRTGVDLDDLAQVGCIGLLRAVHRYDPSLGFSFEAYASRLIAGEIAHFLRDLVYLIRPPRELVELRPAVRAAMASLAQQPDHEPTEREIARRLGISPEKVREVLALDQGLTPISLDAVPPGSPEATALEVEAPRLSPLSLDERLTLQDGLDRLSPPLREVIDLCYFQDLSQQEASRRLGISQAQVSRRLRLALKELRRHIGGKDATRVG